MQSRMLNGKSTTMLTVAKGNGIVKSGQICEHVEGSQKYQKIGVSIMDDLWSVYVCVCACCLLNLLWRIMQTSLRIQQQVIDIASAAGVLASISVRLPIPCPVSLVIAINRREVVLLFISRSCNTRALVVSDLILT